MFNVYLAVFIFTFAVARANVVECGGSNPDSATCIVSETSGSLDLEEVDSTSVTKSYKKVVFNNTDGDDLQLDVADELAPARVLVNIKNYGANTNVVINNRSRKVGQDSAPVVIIGDILNNATINTKGKDGDSYSHVCARKFLNGDFGQDKMDAFLDRRTMDPDLSPNKCDAEDIALLDDLMNCSADHVEDPLISDVDNKVEVLRAAEGKVCQAQVATDQNCRFVVLSIQGRYAMDHRVDSSTAYINGLRYYTNIVGPHANDSRTGYAYWGVRYHDAITEYRFVIPTNYGTPIPTSSSAWYKGYKTIGTRLNSKQLSKVTWGGGASSEGVCHTTDLNYPYYTNAPTLCGFRPSTITDMTENTSYAGGYDLFTSVTTLIDEDRILPFGLNCVDNTVPYSSSETNGAGDPKKGLLLDTIFQARKKYIAKTEPDLACLNIPKENPASTLYGATGNLERSPEVGSAIELCGPNNCDGVIRNLQSRATQLDTVSATPATGPGKIVALVYDGNIVAQSGAGNAGVANDINVQEKVRYCKSIKDLATEGDASEYAINPLISLDRVQWQALRPVAGSGQTTITVPADNISVYKKVSQSVRFLVENQADFLFPKN